MVIAYRTEYQEIEYEGKNVVNNGGFSTVLSRSSKEYWDFAQRICPKVFIYYGKVLLIVEIISTYVSLKINVLPVYFLGTLMGLLVFAIAFLQTDLEVEYKMGLKNIFRK